LGSFGLRALSNVPAGPGRTALGKSGEGWDTAYACLFPASNGAKYVTAHDVVVDGGVTAKFS
jgi:NAD(P)-dependent dehydrogenase (short-subunit alcohol dehydrogenase family)